jgi:hypothetical protein
MQLAHHGHRQHTLYRTLSPVRGQTPEASLAACGVCPLRTILASRSRPCGVRRAFLWMSILLSKDQLTSRQHQLPRSEPMDNLLKAHISRATRAGPASRPGSWSGCYCSNTSTGCPTKASASAGSMIRTFSTSPARSSSSTPSRTSAPGQDAEHGKRLPNRQVRLLD